jgi:hypothetical protein
MLLSSQEKVFRWKDCCSSMLPHRKEPSRARLHLHADRSGVAGRPELLKSWLRWTPYFVRLLPERAPVTSSGKEQNAFTRACEKLTVTASLTTVDCERKRHGRLHLGSIRVDQNEKGIQKRDSGKKNDEWGTFGPPGTSCWSG